MVRKFVICIKMLRNGANEVKIERTDLQSALGVILKLGNFNALANTHFRKAKKDVPLEMASEKKF